MRVDLHYGRGSITLEIPAERLAGVQRLPASAAGGPSDDEVLDGAFAELNAAGFREACAGRTVGLMLSDGTRTEPRARIHPRVQDALAGAREVIGFLCTGTHDPELPENLALARELRGSFAAAPFEFELVVHDSRRGPFEARGRTARGTQVAVEPRASSCELFLAISDMKNHYFAGYSNPGKCYVPGIAAFETVRANHALALDPSSRAARHPWHPDPARRSNPLAGDLVEAFGLVVGPRQHYAVCLVSGEDHVLWAGGGHTAEVAGRGMGIVDRHMSAELEPTQYLIVSAGGHPLDESLYTAQRALELSREALLPGGEVLFLAACANGIGPASSRENFFDRLAAPLDDVLAGFQGEYVMYSHKAFKFAQYLASARAVHVHSSLPPDELRSVHLLPTVDPGAVVARWLREAGPRERITVVADGSKLALRASEPSQRPTP